MGKINPMKIKVVIHEAEEGGYWAEVPALPGCFSQGETMDEMLANIREAIACHLDVSPARRQKRARVREVEI
jgi:predicted RNase H-like HicB family nuclease